MVARTAPWSPPSTALMASVVTRSMLVCGSSVVWAHEEVAAMARGKIDPLPFIDGLLDPYKMVTV